MRTVLIANRNEIAVRIIHACAERGLRTVAVYADSDAQAPHVRLADEAWALEGDSPAETYLDIPRILEIARRSGATDVHPGYGFLAESAAFARAVLDAGLRWIGPSPETIEALGDKIRARAIATAAGAPLAPGTDGPLESAAQAREFAQEHGLPVIIKAAHGGGGRGMRVVHALEEVEEAFVSAAREAEAAFGRGECFVERFLERPRHVEAQVLADHHGTVLVLGTRDCTLQRRHQKLVEEAPAPFLDQEQRQSIEDAAARILAEAGYTGAGTCEFLVAQDGLVSFLEVNTRIQVEHPVTEEAYGVDLVGLQLDIAAGQRLPQAPAPSARGHALEFRINAEDPGRGFLPAGGTVTSLVVPTGPGIRFDSGIVLGSEVAGHFDSLLAKLVVTAPTREQALARARRALREMSIGGVATTLPFHRAVLEQEDFTDEPFSVHTTWIESEFSPALEPEGGFSNPRFQDPDALGALEGRSRAVCAGIEVDGRLARVRIPAAALRELGQGLAREAGGLAAASPATEQEPGAGAAEEEAAAEATAALSGSLVRWLVEDGETVTEGQPLAVLEVMKTEVPLESPASGVFRRAELEPGTALSAGTVLGRVLPAASARS